MSYSIQIFSGPKVQFHKEKFNSKGPVKSAFEIISFAAHRCRYESKITKRKNCGFDSNFGD